MMRSSLADHLRAPYDRAALSPEEHRLAQRLDTMVVGQRMEHGELDGDADRHAAVVAIAETLGVPVEEIADRTWQREPVVDIVPGRDWIGRRRFDTRLRELVAEGLYADDIAPRLGLRLSSEVVKACKARGLALRQKPRHAWVRVEKHPPYTDRCPTCGCIKSMNNGGQTYYRMPGRNSPTLLRAPACISVPAGTTRRGAKSPTALAAVEKVLAPKAKRLAKIAERIRERRAERLSRWFWRTIPQLAAEDGSHAVLVLGDRGDYALLAVHHIQGAAINADHTHGAPVGGFADALVAMHGAAELADGIFGEVPRVWVFLPTLCRLFERAPDLQWQGLVVPNMPGLGVGWSAAILLSKSGADLFEYHHHVRLPGEHATYDDAVDAVLAWEPPADAIPCLCTAPPLAAVAP